MSALVRLGGADAAAVELIAFSAAGAGGHAYQHWAGDLAPGVALWGVRLPGREARRAEPPAPSVADLVAPLAAEIAARPGPVALFGHSFGALLAYAVGCALADAGRGPVWVGLCGLGPGPADLRLDPDAPDEELLAALAVLGAPAEPALLRATLPALRADLRAARAFLPVRGPALRCPVGLFGGLADVPRGVLLGWRALAAGVVGLRRYPGGHFELLREPGLVGDVCADARRAATRLPAA